MIARSDPMDPFDLRFVPRGDDYVPVADWHPGHVLSYVNGEGGFLEPAYVKLAVGQRWRFHVLDVEPIEYVDLTVVARLADGEVILRADDPAAARDRLVHTVALKKGQQASVPLFKLNKDATFSAHEAWDLWQFLGSEPATTEDVP